jgi:hypothetical protein
MTFPSSLGAHGGSISNRFVLIRIYSFQLSSPIACHLERNPSRDTSKYPDDVFARRGALLPQVTTQTTNADNNKRL